MYRRIRPHLPQVFRYLAGGFGAAGLELGSFQLMLWLGAWYLAAGIASAAVGLLSAFAFHKYFVFKKRELSGTGRQAVRYAVLQGFNAIAQVYMLYAFVEFGGMHPFLGKILAIGVTVLWNFFLYKFFVYA